MRCTRCDRLAVPQAVGLTPEGLVAFGWCVPCLEDAGCDQVVVARRSRTRSTRLRPRAYRGRARAPRAGAGAVPWDDRRRVVGALALVLGVWGFALLGAGVTLRHPPGVPPSPFGNGTPALLTAGGAATVLAGVCLGAAAVGRAGLRSRAVWKGAQIAFFSAAVAVILSGITSASRRNDTRVTLTAAAALAASAVARRMELRLPAPAPPVRPDRV